MEKTRRLVLNSLKLLGLALQHLAAPLVSFVFSYASAFLVMFCASALRWKHWEQYGFAMGCGFIGFCGVFMGARCLPPLTQRFGSVGLLLLGLFYFCHYIASWGPEAFDGEMIDASRRSLAQSIFLGLGGLTAVIVIWWMAYLEREFPHPKHRTH